ncbi:MAG: glycosyltransferase [Bacteroidales bacterium]|jgi:glycosyltransferase involved in cell wall biosynthesis|nr:glycosyltransferase [Bacteroidales bacterium]
MSKNNPAISNPKISVIIPVYNTGIALKRCMKAILNQSFTNFECLLIDDGSTDLFTIHFCILCSKKDKRVRYFQKQNEGIERTRVYGIKRAIGDYIIFSDHDDFYHRDAFQILYNKAINSHSDIVIATNYDKYVSWLPVGSKSIGIYSDMDVERNSFINDYYCNFFGINKFPVTTWNKLYKRNLLQDIEYEYLGFNFFEDIILNIQIFPNANKISFISDILYTHIYGGISSGSNYDAENILNGYVAGMDFKIKYLKKYHLYDVYFKYVYFEVKNVLIHVINKMIEYHYSKEEFIRILRNFKETRQFDQLFLFYTESQPTINEMKNNEFEKIYDETVSKYKHKFAFIHIKKILRYILAKL